MNKLSAFRRAAGIAKDQDTNDDHAGNRDGLVLPETNVQPSEPSSTEDTPPLAEADANTTEPMATDVPAVDAAVIEQPTEPTTSTAESSSPEPATSDTPSEPPAEPSLTKVKRSKGVPKTRIIVMVDRDTAEIISSFKLSHSAVVRAVAEGARNYLSNITGEITEADLTAQITAKLS